MAVKGVVRLGEIYQWVSLMFTIYLITNTLNQKPYIGFTTEELPERRFSQHIKAARNGSQDHIHRAFRKHGIENFSFEVVKQGADEEWGLLIEEPYHIALYDAFSNGYNMTTGGRGILGYRHNKETKNAQTLRMRGNHNALGYKHTEAIKHKQSIRMKGVPKIQISCIHCQKTGGINTMKRWHFENCRKRIVNGRPLCQ